VEVVKIHFKWLEIPAKKNRVRRYEVTAIEDAYVVGNWRQWLGDQVKMDTDEDFWPRETRIPGVYLVGRDAVEPFSGVPNRAAARVEFGGPGDSPVIGQDVRIGGLAIAFGYSDAFGGRLLRLTGSQRVAIEAAAHGEWDAYYRAMDRVRAAQQAPSGIIPNRATGEDGRTTSTRSAPVQPEPTVRERGVVYVTSGWNATQVQALVNALKTEGIPFAWADDGLHLDRKYESRVDALVSDLE
jgi:hypothetical protein